MDQLALDLSRLLRAVASTYTLHAAALALFYQAYRLRRERRAMAAWVNRERAMASLFDAMNADVSARAESRN